MVNGESSHSLKARVSKENLSHTRPPKTCGLAHQLQREICRKPVANHWSKGYELHTRRTEESEDAERFKAHFTKILWAYMEWMYGGKDSAFTRGDPAYAARQTWLNSRRSRPLGRESAEAIVPSKGRAARKTTFV
jgi:hypothetical protein